MAALPLYAPVESRDGSLTKGAFLKNAFVEKVGEAMNTFRRPGLSAFSTSTAGAGQGITNYYAPDGSEFLFSAVGGQLYSNGARTPASEWTGSSALSCSGTPAVIADLAIVSYGGLVWAIGGNDRAGAASPRFVVYYSSDAGTTWTKLLDVAESASYPAAGSWLACVHNNRIYLVHGKDNAGNKRECWYTTNGTTWTQASAATGVTDAVGNYVLSSTDGYMYMFLATTTAPVWKSTDGATWASTGATQAFNTGGTQRTGYGCAVSGDTMYVAGGDCSGASTRKIYSSTTGASWSEVGSDVLSGIYGATGTCAAALLRMTGVFYLFELYDSSVQTKIWASTNMTTWTQVGTWTQSDSTDPDFEFSGATLLANCCTPYAVHGNDFYFNGFKFDGLFASNYVWKLATTFSGTMQSIGTVGSGFVDFAQNYNRSVMMIKASDTAYQYTLSSTALTQITDADYPIETVRGVVYLNGIFYVMDPDGNIYGSDNEDMTSWSALNFIACEFEADGGVALAKYGFYVVAFGEYTTEFFFDAGNATGSALSPVQNGVLNVGCADGDTVAFVDDTILFVGRAKGNSQSVTGARFVAQLEGTSYKRLSSPDIDRILLADDFADVEAIAFSVAGHSFYCLNLGTSALSLVYDLSQQTWTVWNRRRTSFTANPVTVITTNGTATWTGTHSFADGDVGVFTGGTGTHTSLNGTYNVTVPASGTLCWRLGGTSYAGTNTATITGTGYSESDFGVVGACGYAGAQLAQDASNGKLYTISPSAYQDDSVYMDWEARMAKLDMGSNKAKFAAYADFISDRASGNVLMRMSDDDSQTWTKFKPKSLALNRTRFTRGGSFLRRVYDFRITDNIPIRAQRVEYQVDEGAE